MSYRKKLGEDTKTGNRKIEKSRNQKITIVFPEDNLQKGTISMAVVKINGRKFNLPEGKNILDAALENNIYIPHLCHHPDLKPMGSCRMCIVEVEGEGIKSSCTLKARDGLVINTESETLKKLRMLALELLLTGHPEDCSTCPKYGNCELQTLIQYIGPKTGRMKMRNKGFAPITENPLIEHDMNRCILCGRCVRACNELRGVKVLQFMKKDTESYVGTLHNRLLVDADCRFCGACAEVCPTGTIRDKLRAGFENSSREDTILPCRAACPAHTDVPRYLRYVKEVRYDDAAAVIREKAPFPHVLGMICTHACELECKRREINSAMAIRDIKRYAAEHDSGAVWRKNSKQLPDTGKRVCVVGGGPAGLTAAYYLRKQGHDVTLKEALPKVGGMMSYGIPSYRLPREITDKETKVISDAGVKFETGCRIDNPKALLSDYDAVVMAIGAHRGVRLPMEGSELPGVILNIDFLRNCAMGKETGIGKRVIVLGGGNVAFDCARSAVRLGAEEVHIACLEAREKMTADDEEIEEAIGEGIHVHPAKTFERITGETCVTGVEFMNVRSFSFDENRRAVIEKEPGTLHRIDADTVIFATGQKPDIDESFGLELFRGAYIVVDKDRHTTSENGIFAAGDVVYGTKSVIMAIESGREVASEVDIYLGGDGDISEKLAPEDDAPDYIGREDGFGREERIHCDIDSPEKRRDNFDMYNHGICGGDICKEAGRCLQCDLRLRIKRPRLWGDFEGGEKK